MRPTSRSLKAGTPHSAPRPASARPKAEPPKHFAGDVTASRFTSHEVIDPETLKAPARDKRLSDLDAVNAVKFHGDHDQSDHNPHKGGGGGVGGGEAAARDGVSKEIQAERWGKPGEAPWDSKQAKAALTTIRSEKANLMRAAMDHKSERLAKISPGRVERGLDFLVTSVNAEAEFGEKPSADEVKRVLSDVRKSLPEAHHAKFDAFAGKVNKALGIGTSAIEAAFKKPLSGKDDAKERMNHPGLW